MTNTSYLLTWRLLKVYGFQCIFVVAALMYCFFQLSDLKTNTIMFNKQHFIGILHILGRYESTAVAAKQKKIAEMNM